MRKLRTLHEFLIEQLADPAAAIDYLQVTLEEYQIDEDTPFFLREIWTVVEAQGGISKLAKKTGIAPEILKEVLSSEDAPRINLLSAIFTALGCRLSIQPLETTVSNAELAAAETSTLPSEISSPSSEVSVEKR